MATFIVESEGINSITTVVVVAKNKKAAKNKVSAGKIKKITKVPKNSSRVVNYSMNPPKTDITTT